MPHFFSDGHELVYQDEGSGDPILLVHGFASNRTINWVYPGWVETLVKAGRRVIIFDNRGHGESAKFYDPEEYRLTSMAEDARALLDHLSIERADVMGYSMGARIAAVLTIRHPDRVRSLVLGGVGQNLMTGGGSPEVIASALEAQTLAEVSDPNGRAFRQFAEQTKSDRKALAACMRGFRQAVSEEELGRILQPVLIAVGTRDKIAAGAHDLAKLIPNATVVDIPNRDHMVAVGDLVFKKAVVDFLAKRT
ncbi:alpha/beta fold hydrolase [Mongoliimonas terrestris]|uniref:alpha/beta fold hydrolase n=1 Tax=Mongoliimonas terrestris TaxID=1709001 RepID=UPI000949AD7C|nr:alpha/beta hydrolase [Mongoliimonas terrestris]